jgi:drug/metabolite transporter (DMT)-like permease
MRGAVSRKGWVLFAVMCLVWGIPYLFIKVAVGQVSVPVVVFARTAIGALVLLPLAVRSARQGGGELGALRRHWRPLAAFAALEIIIPWGLLSAAERKLPSSLAGLLIAAVPIISVVTARLTGGTERLSPRRWAGLVIGLAGVAVLAAPDLTGGSAAAVAEVLLVALCYATAPLIAARKLAEVPALPMTAACLSLGALVWLPPAIATWPTRVPSGRALGALAALGIVCTAFAFLVFLALIREAGTSRAMVFTYVNPAVAVAAGVAFLSEPFTVTIAASFALILAGSLLATWAARAPETPQTPDDPEAVSRRRPPRLRSRSSDPASAGAGVRDVGPPAPNRRGRWATHPTSEARGCRAWRSWRSGRELWLASPDTERTWQARDGRA